MNMELQKIKNIHAEIAKLDKENEGLLNKSKALDTERGCLEQKIAEGSQKYEDAILKNVSGDLPDSALSNIQKENSDLAFCLQTATAKLKAIDGLLKKNKDERKKLTQRLPFARLNFIQKAFDGLAKSVDEKTKNLICELWTLARRLPGGDYEDMLRELFPQENIEKVMDRWNRFHKKYENYIEH